MNLECILNFFKYFTSGEVLYKGVSFWRRRVIPILSDYSWWMTLNSFFHIHKRWSERREASVF
jgi:hypothetical protein